MLARRNFKLPLLSQLTTEQQKILRLPLEGHYVVVGAPGTGKSVIALHRLAKYRNGSKVKLLTFNHVLKHSNAMLTESGVELNTAMSFIYTLHYELTGNYIPEAPQSNMQKKSNEVSPDYEKLYEIFDAHRARFESGFGITDLVVDEAQDLPIGYYNALMELGFKNFFVVADQNQQIKVDNSSIEELEQVFTEAHMLTQNHRNTTPIAKLTRHFYTDPASPLPELPDRPSIDTPTLISYTTVNKCVENILREADNGPEKLIGVIVPSDAKRQDYVKKLSSVTLPNNKHGTPIISTYSSDQKQTGVNIPFDQGGIVVLCDKSVKGIEFDTVYIVLDGLKIIGDDVVSMKKRLYVMTSRAKDKLFILQSHSIPNGVTHLLPTDEKILKRKVI